MKALLEWIRKDMKPALGVTEPAAIALACAAARAMTEEPAECLLVRENSGIYKNAFTCGIPGTDKIGNEILRLPWAVWREIRKKAFWCWRRYQMQMWKPQSGLSRMER